MIKNINTILFNFKRDMGLLFNSPREYIYSFTFSGSRKVVMNKFDNNAKKTGLILIKKLSKSIPEIELMFIGSVFLEISGQNDIDIVSICKDSELFLCVNKLIDVLGKPAKCKREFSQWDGVYNGYKYELLLSTPDNRLLNRIIIDNTLISNNKDYLESYTKLKENSNGFSYREYERRRIAFFNRIRKENISI